MATGLGIGFLPFCPGTFASFAGIGVYALLARLTAPFQIGIILCTFFLGVWAAKHSEVIWNKKDPGEVVIDEIVGYLITTFFIPFSLIRAFGGFFIFRGFDIIKPFPIKRFEKIPGGWGIMMDDVIAGVYAAIILRVLLKLFSGSSVIFPG